MMINLTQHDPSVEQMNAGVFCHEEQESIRMLLTFESLPSKEEMESRAQQLAELAAETGVTRAMIGGAPFFMSTLEQALHAIGIQPVYAFSLRESVEQVQEDGSTRKVNVFRHIGFVEV
ncbi:MAG: hypothetical protein ACWGQW_01930 [bacterium]